MDCENVFFFFFKYELQCLIGYDNQTIWSQTVHCVDSCKIPQTNKLHHERVSRTFISALEKSAEHLFPHLKSQQNIYFRTRKIKQINEQRTNQQNRQQNKRTDFTHTQKNASMNSIIY